MLDEEGAVIEGLSAWLASEGLVAATHQLVAAVQHGEARKEVATLSARVWLLGLHARCGAVLAVSAG